MIRLKRALLALSAATLCSCAAWAEPPFPSLNVIGRYGCYAVQGPATVVKEWKIGEEGARITIRDGLKVIAISEMRVSPADCNGRVVDEIRWSKIGKGPALETAHAELCVTPFNGGVDGWLLLGITAEAPTLELLNDSVNRLQSVASCHVGRQIGNDAIFHGDQITVYRQILGKRL